MPRMFKGSGGAIGRPAPKQGYGKLETSGLPQSADRPDAAKPHPTSARIFNALVKKPAAGKKVGAAFSVKGGRGLPVPFNNADSPRPWGAATRFGPLTGRRSF